MLQKGYSSTCPGVRMAPHIHNGWLLTLLTVIQLIEKNIEHNAPFLTLLINLLFGAQVSYSSCGSSPPPYCYPRGLPVFPPSPLTTLLVIPGWAVLSADWLSVP